MFSRLFSGEEGFENTGEHIIRDTSAGIIDGQTNILSWSGSFRPVRVAIDNCIECFKSQNATRLHGVFGIEGQVQDDQFNLGWIEQGGPKVCCHFHSEPYVPPSVTPSRSVIPATLLLTSTT